MTAFGRFNLYQDNPGEVGAPGIGNDSTQGYGPGSRWYDTRFNIMWNCIDGTAGAAKWFPHATQVLLASLIGANMNVTTDQPLIPRFDLTALKYAVNSILVTNASLSLTTAVGGVYTAAAKAGTAIVAATQAYSGLTVSTSLLAATIAAAGSASVFSVAPILSLTTAQGAAATVDVYLIGTVIPSA